MLLIDMKMPGTCAKCPFKVMHTIADGFKFVCGVNEELILFTASSCEEYDDGYVYKRAPNCPLIEISATDEIESCVITGNKYILSETKDDALTKTPTKDWDRYAKQIRDRKHEMYFPDNITVTADPPKSRLRLIDVACPMCGEKIYINEGEVLASYPPKSEYRCKACGWIRYV